jgi:hypothetical protein
MSAVPTGTRTAVVCYGWEFDYQQDDGSSVQLQTLLDHFMRDRCEMHRPVSHHMINLVDLVPNLTQRPAAQLLIGICPCSAGRRKLLMENVAASIAEEPATGHRA